MDNEEIFLRQLIAHYMSYRAAVLQDDGYMTDLYFGFTNNMKHVLMERFGRSDEELQALIARAERIVAQQ